MKAGLAIGVEQRFALTTVNAVRVAALLLADVGELERAVEQGELARPLIYGTASWRRIRPTGHLQR